MGAALAFFQQSCRFPADLVTFTEEILNEKLHLLDSVYSPKSPLPWMIATYDLYAV